MEEATAVTASARMSASAVSSKRENKKRPIPNADDEPTSTKRPRLARDHAEEPTEKAKSTRGSRKIKDPAVKKQVHLKGSATIKWSVVSALGSSPPQKPPEPKRADVRPRLWSSTREELVSTFAEISGSKCVNNISWMSTQMPILILEDELVSVEKPPGKGNKLYMDVTFARECRYKTSSMPSVDAPSNAPNNTGDPKIRAPGQMEAQAPVISTIGGDGQISEKQNSSQSNDSSPHMPSQKQAQIPVSVAYHEAPNASITPNIPASETQEKDGPTTQTPTIAPPRVSNQLGGQNPTRPKKASALSSLKFTKIKHGPDAPLKLDHPTTPHSDLHSTSQPPPRTDTFFDSDPDGAFPPGLSKPMNVPLSYPPNNWRSENNLVQSHTQGQSQPLPQREGPIPLTTQAGWHHGQTILEPFSQVNRPFRDHQVTPAAPTTEVGAYRENHSNPWHTIPHNLDTQIFLDSRTSNHKISEKYTSVIPTTSFPSRPNEEPKVTSVYMNGPEINSPLTPLSDTPTCLYCTADDFDPNCPDCGNKAISVNICNDEGPAGRSTPRTGVDFDQPIVPSEVTLATSADTMKPSNSTSKNRKPRRKEKEKEESGSMACNDEEPAEPTLPSEVILTPSIDEMKPSKSSSRKRKRKGKEKEKEESGSGACSEEPAKSNSPETGLHFDQPTLPSEVMLTVNIDAEKPSDSSSLKPELEEKGKGKGKGKEILRESGWSSDKERPPVTKQRSSKKAKLNGDSFNGESTDPSHQMLPIATSSKTKLDHLPTDQQMPATESFIESVIERSISSNSNAIRSTKPKRRKGKHYAEAEKSFHPRQDPLEIKAEGEVPSHPILDLQELEGEGEALSHPANGSGSLEDCINDSLQSSISGVMALKSKSKAWTKLAPALNTPLQIGDNGLPLPVPAELQALVNAYINSVPVGIFATTKQVRCFWGLDLTHQEEIGYAFMGLYRVSRVWEALGGSEEGSATTTREGVGSVSNEGISKHRVQWKFRMGWEPGGEDWLAGGKDNLSSPWWNHKLKVKRLRTSPEPDKEDSDNESTSKYRLARRESPNFPRRYCFFNQEFYSVIPLHLLAPMNAEMPDSALPPGWHCGDCGKLNFRYYLRHRRCGSSYCKGKREVGGYVVEIDRLRDPQDALPLSLPLDEMHKGGHVKAKIQGWSDRMKTLLYGFGMGAIGQPITVHHVFTCNSRNLQQEPSELFNLLQIHVPLRKTTGDISTNPYFTHFVDHGNNADRAISSWNSVHGCLLRAKELMQSRTTKYVGMTNTDVNISRLEIRAWVTAGSKRASDLLCAKQRCIIIMCLGCEVIMNITPKSATAPNDNQTHIPDLDKLIPMDSFDPGEDQLQIRSGEGVKVETDLAPEETEKQTGPSGPPSARAKPSGVAQKRDKVDKVVLSMSLIHGDIMVLAGDDFEYSIKRSGTSILLIGS